MYPYLLENLVITGPNQVWGTDITYIPTRYGWVYLTAIMDLYSRMILGWRVSGTLEAAPCIQLLKDTVRQYGAPNMLNQDQGTNLPRLSGLPQPKVLTFNSAWPVKAGVTITFTWNEAGEA